MQRSEFRDQHSQRASGGNFVAYTPVDFRRALDLLIAGKIDLTPWTVRMPLARGQEALDRMSHHPGVSLKMMLEAATT